MDQVIDKIVAWKGVVRGRDSVEEEKTLTSF